VCDPSPEACLPFDDVDVIGGQFVATNGTTFGSVLNVTCDAGFGIPSGAVSGAVCLPDGRWTAPLSTLATACKGNPCVSLPLPAQGVFLCDGQLYYSDYAFHYMDNITVGCVDGYGVAVNGVPKTNNVATQTTCGISGQYEPSVTLVDCVQCSPGASATDNTTFQCECVANNYLT
jgi:hypothetical protein